MMRAWLAAPREELLSFRAIIIPIVNDDNNATNMLSDKILMST